MRQKMQVTKGPQADDSSTQSRKNRKRETSSRAPSPPPPPPPPLSPYSKEEYDNIVVGISKLVKPDVLWPSKLNDKLFAAERKALVELKRSFVDDSHQLQSWTGENCCGWKGVECSRETGHVVKLDLHNPVSIDYDSFYNDPVYAENYSRSCLGGEVSNSLLNLSRLVYLDLSSNNFSYTEIPSFMGSLKSLRYLKLSGARFGGKVPPYLGNLSSLEYLDLSDFSTNRLTDTSSYE